MGSKRVLGACQKAPFPDLGILFPSPIQSKKTTLLIELIAHALADKETSMLRVAHDQAVARQRQKLTADDFGVAMHIAWTRHLLDNREFIVGGGTQPNTEPSRGEGLDGSATAEERDNYHRDAYENARNHASGPPAARSPLTRALPHHTHF